MLELETPHGPARAHLHPAEAPRAALVLGHGAGGGVTAPDLVAATAAALAAGRHRRARRAALPRRRAALAGSRGPARRGVDRGRRAAARRLAERPAARRRRPLLGCARRLPHRRRDRCRRGRLPRVPAPAAGKAVRAEPAARARRRRRPDARRPGRGRPVRDAAAVEAADRRRRAGQSQPPCCRAGSGGGAGLAFAAALTVRTYVRVEKATILHADLDAFFASVEQRDEPQPARPAGARRHGRRARCELRGEGVRRPHRDERAPGARALSARGRRQAALLRVRRGEQGRLRGVRGHDAARRGALDRRGVSRRARHGAGLRDACRDRRAPSARRRSSGSACRSRSASPGRSSWPRWRARSRNRTGCSSSRPTRSSRSCIRCRSSGSGASGR